MLALAIEFIRVHLMARNSLSRFGGHSGGETPGPIPNPEVKPSSADGTALETGWESRSPPRLFSIESRLRAALFVSGLHRLPGPQWLSGWLPERRLPQRIATLDGDAPSLPAPPRPAPGAAAPSSAASSRRERRGAAD